MTSNSIQSPISGSTVSSMPLDPKPEPQKQPAKSLTEQIKLKATEEILKSLTQKAPAPVKKEIVPSQVTRKSYGYEAAWGPFKVRCLSEYDKDLKNLDKILMFLDDPDMKTTDSYVLKLVAFQGKMMKRLSRLWNLLFGDHRWYNERCARKLIKYFAIDCAEKNKTEHLRAAVLKVHCRLADLSRGSGTWADGIDRSLLEKHSFFSMDNAYQLFQSLPELQALKQTAQTIGRIAIAIGKLWLNDQAQKRFGQEKLPYLDLKATDLTQLLVTSLLK